MAPLWIIEEDIRGQDAELRTSVRAEQSRSIVAELFAMLDQELPRISGKSKLAEIIRYTWRPSLGCLASMTETDC